MKKKISKPNNISLQSELSELQKYQKKQIGSIEWLDKEIEILKTDTFFKTNPKDKLESCKKMAFLQKVHNLCELKAMEVALHKVIDIRIKEIKSLL